MVIFRLVPVFIWRTTPLKCTFSVCKRHLNQLNSPKVTIDSDLTHNRNSLKIIDSANGQRFLREDLSCGPFEDPIVANAYFDFLTICPKFYFTENRKIKKLLKVLPKLAENNVILVLKAITLWEINRLNFEPIIRKIVNNIDNELIFRLKMKTSEDINRKLSEDYNRYSFAANLFFRLNSHKRCKFNKLLIRWLTKKHLTLTKSQLLEFLFYVSLVRDVERKTIDYIVGQTERVINDMSLEEMSIVCMTFFKIGFKLNDHLIRIVIRKTLDSISDRTDSYTKTDVLKVIRFSYKFVYKQEVYDLIQRYKQLDNNLFTLIQLISLLSKAKLYDKSIFDQTFEIFRSNPREFRPKYVERLILSAEELNHKIDSQIISNLSQHITNNKINFNENLCQILSHFSVFKFYPKELIEYCFDRNFLDRIENTISTDFQTSILKLNSCLSIERFEEFSHLLLDENRIQRFRQKSMYYQKSWSLLEIQRREAIEELCQRLSDRLSEECLRVCYVFPFDVQPTIIAVKRSHHKFDINLDYSELREGMFENWTSIRVLHLTDYSTYDRTRLTATVSLRNRLLDRLGFRTIALNHNQLIRVLDSDQELDRFVVNII